MKKHSVVIMGHATSLSLEEAFWDELKQIAKERQVTVVSLIEMIDQNRQESLSGAIRLFILKALKQKIPQNK